ncbi:hypothetical protein GQ53DRAFT_437852 [Thozetella sp. PMI_491]|nr:hypothetical protein GQ53DRAFT_437852 [Thozetella sp. PMI_491]
MMAGRVQSRISQKRPSTALISVLLEFQEVQGFFIIAIQLATLATFGSNGGAGSLSSISSFINFFANVLLVQTFAVNGIMPILLLQCVLQRAGVRWWYLFGITLISLVLAVIIQVRNLTLGPDFATLWNYFKDRAPVMACGGNPSPMTYCTARIDEITFLADNGLDQSLTVAGIAAASLLIQQAFWTLTKRVRRLGVELRRMEAQSQLFRVVRRRVLPPAIALYWLGIQVTLFYFVGTYLALLLNIAQAVGMDASSWTYGQLIAVMVWAPTIGKYIYFNFFGVEEGLTKRLSKYFKVVRRKPEELEESASLPEKLGFE